LGFISKFSMFRILIDKSKCTSCGLCRNSCKSECIDIETSEIDVSRCVDCYNCLKACNLSGFKYSFAYNRNKEINTNNSKREFLAEAGIATAMLMLPQGCQPKKDKIAIERFQLVTPPGSKNLNNFTGKCTACYACVAACPTQVLQPTFIAYGINGIFQPRMDYHKSFCNYECTVCGEVCPSGAILPLVKEKKKYTQTGKVKFIKEECIVETKKTDCGACSEHCPTKACHMVAYGNLVIPEVNNEICIGCGACEFACPTKPHKAIYVVANKYHQIAKKPETKNAQEQYKAQEDFPF
jgi:ferredoxin